MKKIMLFAVLIGLASISMAQVKVEAAKPEAVPESKSISSKCGSQDCQTVMKLKREYIEKNFTLTEEQKAPFWAAFDEYAKSEYAAFQKSREALRAAGIEHHVAPDSIQYLSDNQIVSLYTIRLETRRNLLEAESAFLNAISQCLSAKQVNEYFQLERKFKRSAASHRKASKDSPDNKEKCPQKRIEAAPAKSVH